MIRVALIVTFSDQGWLGGVSYFRNLLRAIHMLPDRRIEPVLFTSPMTDHRLLAGYPEFERVCSPLLSSRGLAWTLRRVWAKASGTDSVLAQLLRQHRVDILSHQGFLAGTGEIPSIAWIPDFQEMHLPEFFSDAERIARSRKLALACRVARTILVSSEDARRDLQRAMPGAVRQSRVLQFVAYPDAAIEPTRLAALEERYRFTGRYFHLPNQYWAHKNHRAVIEALAILKAQGRAVMVLATGNADDHRQPGYYASLQELLRKHQLEGSFRMLGVVPQVDLVGLMTESVAVINPSLFEGWSTTVEESKSLGKRVLLSDIAVHREQAPARGQFFDPHDANELAQLLWTTWNDWDRADESSERERARRLLPQRCLDFARNYEQIVIEAVGKGPSND